MEKIKVKLLRPDAQVPARATADSAGADLHACMDGPVTVAPGETAFIGTGLAAAIPSGWAGLVFARSGLACKKGLAPANKVGVIDSDYRGEIKVALHNHGTEPVTVTPGDRIAQLALVPVCMAEYEASETLEDTDRGAGGFGSTGK